MLKNIKWLHCQYATWWTSSSSLCGHSWFFLWAMASFLNFCNPEHTLEGTSLKPCSDSYMGVMLIVTSRYPRVSTGFCREQTSLCMKDYNFESRQNCVTNFSGCPFFCTSDWDIWSWNMQYLSYMWKIYYFLPPLNSNLLIRFTPPKNRK
jgi:hypothetical protein